MAFETVQRTIFIIGCGYVGKRVAAKHLTQGDTVLALARSDASAANLRSLGIEPILGDLDQPASLDLSRMAGAYVYHLAPPATQGHGDARTRALVERCGDDIRPAKLVYMSTTAVYGDCGGDWVDENSPVKADSERGRKRLAAESICRNWCLDSAADLVVLRVAGIYAHDRLPVERVQQGLPVIKEEESPPSNRIHADDLTTICLAAMDRATNGSIYNVADGNPTTMADYFNRVADLCRLPRPPKISWSEAQFAFTPAMLAYVNEAKRVRNTKLLEELGIKLNYPTLEKGLKAQV